MAAGTVQLPGEASRKDGDSQVRWSAVLRALQPAVRSGGAARCSPVRHKRRARTHCTTGADLFRRVTASVPRAIHGRVGSARKPAVRSAPLHPFDLAGCGAPPASRWPGAVDRAPAPRRTCWRRDPRRAAPSTHTQCWRSGCGDLGGQPRKQAALIGHQQPHPSLEHAFDGGRPFHIDDLIGIDTALP